MGVVLLSTNCRSDLCLATFVRSPVRQSILSRPVWRLAVTAARDATPFFVFHGIRLLVMSEFENDTCRHRRYAFWWHHRCHRHRLPMPPSACAVCRAAATTTTTTTMTMTTMARRARGCVSAVAAHVIFELRNDAQHVMNTIFCASRLLLVQPTRPTALPTTSIIRRVDRV